MRIAFLTPEYVSEWSLEGKGIGTYVYRMARVLKMSGHEPEVFVPSEHLPQTFAHDGICIHRVNWKESQPLTRLISLGHKRPGFRRLASSGLKISAGRFQRWRSTSRWILQAKALATTLERCHLKSPYSLVQSADYLATGLFVGRRRDRIYVVRCSSAADLYGEIEGNISKLEGFRGYFERLSMRRADLAYAPSRYLAGHFVRTHGINVQIIRPPKFLDIESPLPPPSMPLPDRFFLHFGQLMERKGTALLAQALPLAWKSAPDLTMVWSGRCPDQQSLEYWRSLWGNRATQVHITGPLSRSELYAVLQRADVAVLPSQVDNLPNTVIESLMFGIPVIGSRGASIDELVDEDETGHLVDLGDAKGLADALVRMWMRLSPVRKGFDWNTDIAEEMRPERAVASLVALVRS